MFQLLGFVDLGLRGLMFTDDPHKATQSGSITDDYEDDESDATRISETGQHTGRQEEQTSPNKVLIKRFI